MNRFDAIDYDYKDLQLQTFLADRGAGAAATQIEIAGGATLKGLDLDIFVESTEALTLEASLAFLDGELDEWVTTDSPPTGADWPQCCD